MDESTNENKESTDLTVNTESIDSTANTEITDSTANPEVAEPSANLEVTEPTANTEAVVTIENKESDDNSPQFNIIETNISSSLISKFSSDILVHIFKYSKITGTIELSGEYENILISKKINIIAYLNDKLGCRDVYDIKCTGVRIKKMDENIKKKMSQWFTHDEKYYVSFYFYIATPGSLFEAYLLIITGKKNAVGAEQFAIVVDKQNTINSTVSDIQTQLSASADKIKKQGNLHETLVKEVQTSNDNTTNQLVALNKQVAENNDKTTKQLASLGNQVVENNDKTTNQLTALGNQVVENNDKTTNQLTTLKNQIVENIENVSAQFTNNLNSMQKENETMLHDLKQQLTTNAVDTQSTIKDILTSIDTKIENITKMFKTDMSTMLSKLNTDIQNINDNLSTQEMCIIKLQEMAHGILRSEGDNYVVVK